MEFEGGADAIKGRCMKCRKDQVMKDIQNVKMKNGRDAIRGVCTVCGTKMFKIVGKKGGAQAKRRSRKSKGSRKSRKSRGSRKSRKSGKRRSRRSKH